MPKKPASKTVSRSSRAKKQAVLHIPLGWQIVGAVMFGVGASLSISTGFSGLFFDWCLDLGTQNAVDQYEQCVSQFQSINTVLTAAFSALALFALRKVGQNDLAIRTLALASLVYMVLQAASIWLWQQQFIGVSASTDLGDVFLAVWFALDPLVYYSVAIGASFFVLDKSHHLPK